jgi:hypothetical protein
LKRIAVSNTATGEGPASGGSGGGAGRRFLDRSLRAGASGGEPGLTGCVEGGPQGVVERAQPHLVPGGDLLPRAHEPGARPALLRLDDRPDDTLDRRVQFSHERMGIVEPAAVDADDDLRPRRVERLPLESLDRLAAHLAVEVPRTRPRLEPCEGRFVGSPPRPDDQPAAARGSGRAERDRVRRAADDHARGEAAPHLDLVVEEQRALRVRLGRYVANDLERRTGQVEHQLTAVVLEDRAQLHEVADETAQASAGRKPSVGKRHRHTCALLRDLELSSDRGRDGLVEDVGVQVGLVAAGGQEP